MCYNFPGHLQNLVLIVSLAGFFQLLREELLWPTSSWSFSANEQPTNNVERPLSGYTTSLECFLGLGFFSGWGMFWVFGGVKGAWVFCLGGFGGFWWVFCRELLVLLSWVILLPGREKKNQSCWHHSSFSYPNTQLVCSACIILHLHSFCFCDPLGQSLLVLNKSLFHALWISPGHSRTENNPFCIW